MTKNNISIKKYLLLMIVFILISIGSVLGISKFLKHEINLQEVPYYWYLILGSMTAIYILLDGYRFYVILKTFKINLPYRFVVKQAIIGTFVSNVTPFLAGGSIAQIYFLKERGIPISEAAAATSIRAILASTFFFVSLPIVVYFNPELLSTLNIQSIKWLPLVSLFYVLWTAFIVLVGKYRKKSMIFIEKCVRKLPLKEINKTKLLIGLDDFLKHLDLFLRGDKNHLLLSFLVTVLHFIFVFTFSVVILRLYGYKISPLTVITGQMLSNFVMYFGFTPGASGFAEGGFAYFFSQIVSETDLVNIVFLWRGSTVYLATIIGMVFFAKESLAIRKKHHQSHE
ncbi:lysylphosphatidylglycerol synthase transmembrane domain-containing protein [Fusibacter sp. 3D3]|uniref:lysylphosphatidylglycerol synthase transmembrane domain-containing protein n=1 Tax=Fusibacter sp. 3D3 TaxID=1048380 RepID=UPI000852C1CB|nr:lysylphosphatidylglycerol synthase transmembrane domain-containing protein [Fusibacter sp. 3D3]GAU77663.1 integral membrane protein [Fusibacter sp. 3D3]